MDASLSEIPWLENAEVGNKTAIVKVDPYLDEETIIHNSSYNRWKCLMLDSACVDDSLGSTGLILKITKRVTSNDGEMGYVFVEELVDTFDLNEVSRSNSANKQEETDKNPSKKEYSTQKVDQKRNKRDTIIDQDIMDDIDVSRL